MPTLIPKLLKLSQAVEALGGNIPEKTLRAEIKAGRLRCMRARPSCTAPILLSEADLADWLNQHAANRQRVPNPHAVSEARAAAGAE